MSTSSFSRIAIEVEDARTHNLKGIDCRIPHQQVTVVTGPSGAGKSSLAFDTIFAEGQRRFVESMSTYARQFLGQMERPPVGEMRNILPAIALEAKNSVRNARSTVGTISEVVDVLRLIYTHLGELRCPLDDQVARSFAVEQIVAALGSGGAEGADGAGESFLIVAPVARPKKNADLAIRTLIQQGFARRLYRGKVQRMDSSAKWAKSSDPLPVVLGRFRAKGVNDSRLASAIEEALQLGAGRLEAHTEEEGKSTGEIRFFSRGLGCTQCGQTFRRPEPALFSFNSPLGACPECQGFGRTIGIGRDRVIPDPDLGLEDRPIAAWNTPAYEDHYKRLLAACAKQGVSLKAPWKMLSDGDQEWIWSGKGDFVNLNSFFARLERRVYKVHVRVFLARFRSYDDCPACGGSRLQPEALSIRLHGRTFPDLCAVSIEDFRSWLQARQWTPRELDMAGHLIEELTERIEVLYRVGLDYLTLDRQARTLSGGETQRIHLAAALGTGLTSTLYVLDEPTIGLHSQDSQRLLGILRSLSARGNTVLVVEHDRTLIEGADHVIDLGPMAGEHGGEVIVEGPLETLLACDRSLTASYLRERPQTAARGHVARFRREQGQDSRAQELESGPAFEIEGARAHNLRDITVKFPLGVVAAVTGVSGSGKSTLVENVIHANYQRRRGVVDVEPGACKALRGFEQVSDVILVDQRPIGRSRRSNPVTFLKAYDEVRSLFAAQPLARRRSITPGHFSFNTDKGRCPHCKGTGEVEVDMQFMSAITIPCDECQGRRFRNSVLAVRYQGLNIAETLELTVEQAIKHFSDRPKLVRQLGHLAEAGLGYLHLGQSTATLSGGEAQRLKLASFLSEGGKREAKLLIFDEPTTGLHMADIDLLFRTLRRLLEHGHSVVVVEHSMDLIARADWIIDLGPGGGVRGGELLFSGPLDTFMEQVDSPTAVELRRHLKWEPAEAAAQA